MIKLSSITALRIIDTPKSVDVLIDLTNKSESYHVRDRAITALTRCKSDMIKAKQAITGLTNDIDSRISDKAKELVGKK
jgi:HEAT repeat protein